MRLIDAEPLEEILRSRCAQCSNDYGSLAGAISGCLKLVQIQPTIVSPPNNPLTLEELREMDGKIVYITPINDWAKVVKYGLLYFGTADYNTWNEGIGKTYGDTWLAYRYKPEEGTICK